MFLQSSHSSWRSRYISHIHTILKCYSFVECTLSVSFSNLVNFSTDFTFFFYVLCTYFWMCWSTETYSVVIGTCTILQGVNIVLGCGNLGASTRATSFYFAFTALTELLNSPNVCYCCYRYTIEKKKNIVLPPGYALFYRLQQSLGWRVSGSLLCCIQLSHKSMLGGSCISTTWTITV